MAKNPKHQKYEAALRAFALKYPGAHEEFPWGERVIKVKGKIFVFLGVGSTSESGLGLSVKLPHSRAEALDWPFTNPTGYNLGKSGWISAKFKPKDDVPLELIEQWIDESYHAVAPKRLAATLLAPAAPAQKKIKKKTTKK